MFNKIYEENPMWESKKDLINPFIDGLQGCTYFEYQQIMRFIALVIETEATLTIKP